MEDYKHLVDGVSLSKDDIGELEMWNWAVEELAETNCVSLFSLKFGYGNNTGTGKKERVTPCLRAISAFYSDNEIEEGCLNHEWEKIFTLKIFPLNRNIKDAVHEARELFQKGMMRLKADGIVRSDYDTEWIFRGCLGSFIWNISEILYKRINSLHNGDFYKSGLFSKYHIVALGYADNMNLNDFKPERNYDEYDIEAILIHIGLYGDDDEIDTEKKQMVEEVKSIVYSDYNRPLKETKLQVEELAKSDKYIKCDLAYLYACAVIEWYLRNR